MLRAAIAVGAAARLRRANEADATVTWLSEEPGTRQIRPDQMKEATP